MNDPVIRGIWLAITLLASFMFAVLGGILSYLGGRNMADAIIFGFAVLGGVQLFLLALLAFVTTPRVSRSGGRCRQGSNVTPHTDRSPPRHRER